LVACIRSLPLPGRAANRDVVRQSGDSFLGTAVCSLGIIAPLLLLRRQALKRRRLIERALPNTIDLLLTSIEAGLGVDAAFALVTEKSTGPIAEVLTDYLKEVGLGRARRDALEDVALRSGSQGLAKLAATISQTWEIGSSVGDILRIQAQELREERRRRAQEIAQKAPFWMTIPLALCFMPAMIAVVVVPSILRLLHLINSGFNG
jgi:tight adherence protein C